MANTNVQAAVSAWQNGMNNAGSKIKAGVMGVTQAPGQAAAAQANKMLAGVQSAINSGKWQAAVGAVSLQSWQQSMINKGIANMGVGVSNATQKMTNVMSQLLPQTAAISAQIKAMPNATKADAQARMNAAFQALSNIKITPQGG
jgi:hypothetical protein